MSESLSLVAVWPSPSVPGKVPTDFPEACTQVPRTWPGLSTPWYLALLFCLRSHVLSRAVTARLFTRAKDGCQGQSLAVSGSNFHVVTPQRSVDWEWNRPSYTAQRKTKLEPASALAYRPTLPQEKRNTILLYLLQVTFLLRSEEDTRSCSLKLGTG